MDLNYDMTTKFGAHYYVDIFDRNFIQYKAAELPDARRTRPFHIQVVPREGQDCH